MWVPEPHLGSEHFSPEQGSAPRSELAGSPGEIFLERLNAVITPHFLLRLISYFSVKRNKSPSWKAARCPLWGGGGTGRQAALGKVRWSLPVILHEACLANQLPPPTPSHSQLSRRDVRVPSTVTWAAGSVQQLGLDSRPSCCGAGGALSPSPATLRTPPLPAALTQAYTCWGASSWGVNRGLTSPLAICSWELSLYPPAFKQTPLGKKSHPQWDLLEKGCYTRAGGPGLNSASAIIS